MYKKLFFGSLVINIILLVMVLWPQPKEEKEMIQKFRSVRKEFNKKILVSDHESVTEDAEGLLRDLSETWDPDIMKQRFSKEILNQIGEEKLSQMAEIYKSLGEYKSSDRTDTMNYPTRPNSIVVTMQSVFENGKGTVRLVLTKGSSPRLIEGININSDVFLSGPLRKKE